ncbi:hypothetical protein TREMEDRAFT_64098 [Tremella mesenterica DSM 1558]|uniref:uncharacterized protein n=1 Tax=Tremella mesenterica (strain ATCC 24925 / CBS 8224 / DSM 1558 / NBRC 9311 / NRRL Y-6157 / RJB 2259-6 / UBC 559-6) TaxID=578456 RepID=UPI0003F48F99|nr:uncharacterized protein TREMEDRAFT_64098 [Tremella mesenterica DSM 1558]EIW67516.1 hypothetical protein TREMEDRAFT_64098 [Tremella mesenterica DSM 1558]
MSTTNLQLPLDARRALGRRPGAAPLPRVQIDTTFQEIPSSPIHLQPPSPTNNHVSPSSPQSPNTPKRFRRPTISRPKQPPRSTRGLYETQKLLSHLLDKIDSRLPAPDLLDRAALAIRAISKRDMGKGKGRASKMTQAVVAVTQPTSSSSSSNQLGPSQVGISNEDYDEVHLKEGEWDTEGVFELLEQTRSLLVLSDKQGLDLFTDSRISENGLYIGKKKSGRLSTSPVSPINSRSKEQDWRIEQTSFSGQNLLSRMLHTLSTLTTIEGIHKVHRYRPLCPPNALQSACLDVATFLWHKCGMEVRIRVMGMVIDSMYTFGEEMIERLCEWIEGRLGELLSILERDRGGREKKESTIFTDPFAFTSNDQNLPGFAISTEDTNPPDPHSTTASHVPSYSFDASNPSKNVVEDSKTTGWLRYSPTTPHPISHSTQSSTGISSTYGTSLNLSQTSHHIASLITQLILSLISNIDLRASRPTTIFRVHRLFSLILISKPDAYIDLLEVAAVSPSVPSRRALELLSSFYPHCIGHDNVARRLPSMTYSNLYERWSNSHDRVLGEDEDSHHFVPWKIENESSSSSSSHSPSSTSQSYPSFQKCSTCQLDVLGFCLRCTLCHDIQHLECYNPTDDMFIYEVVVLSQQTSLPSVVSVKFSKSLSPTEDLLLISSSTSSNHSHTRRKVGQHDLRLINLFNLAICNECHEPIWGSTCQAMACLSGCQMLLHPSCVDRLQQQTPSKMVQCRFRREVVIDDISGQGGNPFSLSRKDMEESYERQFPNLMKKNEDLGKLSYDELCVLYGMIWIQDEILQSGLSGGSIRITDHPSRPPDDDKPSNTSNVSASKIDFLKTKLENIEREISTRYGTSQPGSSALVNHISLQSIDQLPAKEYIFSHHFLTYIRTLLRCPSTSSPLLDGLLSAPNSPNPNQEEEIPISYESLKMSSLVQTLKVDLDINHPVLVAYLLDHLRSQGLIAYPFKYQSYHTQVHVDSQLSRTPINVGSNLSPSNGQSNTNVVPKIDRDEWVSFGLPMLMDSTPSIELLVVLIERLLGELDLTLLEVGLGLLVRRTWPDGLSSDYALERLGRAVMGWVMTEDETLHLIVRNYASKHLHSPGIRINPLEHSQATSVSTYQISRQKLLNRYVRPWVQALHILSPELYAHVVYEASKSSSFSPILDPFDSPSPFHPLLETLTSSNEEKKHSIPSIPSSHSGPKTNFQDEPTISPSLSKVQEENQSMAVKIATTALERISKIVDSKLVFTMLLDILIAWLEDLGSLSSLDIIYKPLSKLFGHIQMNPNVPEVEQGIWGVISDVIKQDGGEDRVCRWLRVLAVSNVGIPWETLTDLIDLSSKLSIGTDLLRSTSTVKDTSKRSLSLSAKMDLVVTINLNPKPLDSKELLSFLSKTFLAFSTSLSDHCQPKSADLNTRTTHTNSTEYIDPSNPNTTDFNSPAYDRSIEPLNIIQETDLLHLLFLGILKPYVSSENITNTSLISSELSRKHLIMLSKRRQIITSSSLNPQIIQVCAKLLDLKRHDTEIILDFLWLILTKSSMMDLEGLWDSKGKGKGKESRSGLFWRLVSVNVGPMEVLVRKKMEDDRHTTLETLLIFILEIADSTLSHPPNSHRAAVSLLNIFFDSLMTSDNLSPDSATLLQSLFPTQLEAVSRCYEELLVQSTDDERFVILTKLRKWHNYLPTWPVLSWSCIDSLLSEVVANTQQLPSLSLIDAHLVRTSLLALGLDMLAHEIPIDYPTSQKFQQHVASACSLPWPEFDKGITQLLFPSLRGLLDSPVKMQVGGGMSKVKKMGLAGGVFVPIVLALAGQLGHVGFVEQRCLLDMLLVTFFKHNFRPVELLARKALTTLGEYLTFATCSENRLLAIRTIQVALTNFDRPSITSTAPQLFSHLSRVLVKQTKDNEDYTIIEQSHNLLHTIIKSSWKSGMFLVLFEDESHREDSVLGVVLKMLVDDQPDENSGNGPDIIRGIIWDIMEVFRKDRQYLQNVLKSLYIVVKEQSKQWSEVAVQDFGNFLSRLTKHIADLPVGEFDPDFLLMTCARVFKLAPSTCAVMLLHQTSTMLHLVLTRSDVNKDAMGILSHAAEELCEREKTEDTVKGVVNELCGSMLSGMGVMSGTMGVLLDKTLLESQTSTLQDPSLPQSATNSLNPQQSLSGYLDILLLRHPTLLRPLDPETLFSILIQSSSILLLSESILPGSLPQILTKIIDEPALIQLKMYNMLLLSSIYQSEPKFSPTNPSLSYPHNPSFIQHPQIARKSLIGLFPIIARVGCLCLKASSDHLLVSDSGEGAELLSNVFILLRLALLVVKLAQYEDTENTGERVLWDRIWSEWSRLLGISMESICVNTVS